MPNTRLICDQENNDHALVPPIVELRDNLGVLAVQILAAREDLASLDSWKILCKLYDIICELHTAYGHFSA